MRRARLQLVAGHLKPASDPIHSKLSLGLSRFQRPCGARSPPRSSAPKRRSPTMLLLCAMVVLASLGIWDLPTQAGPTGNTTRGQQAQHDPGSL